MPQQRHINIKVDPEWWAKVCAHAAAHNQFPSVYMKEATDRALVADGVIPEASPASVIWRFRPNPQPR